MRPDEHKKKKSAQYQKKHGTAAAKGAKNENEKNSSKPGKQGSSRSGASERTPHSQHDHGARKIEPSVSTSESEEEGEQTEIQARSFRRREIASNWAKYDLPPADADDHVSSVPRGQDFHKLLQSAGSAGSHFRFKDEESWEDEGVNENGPAAQVLSLDCAELATSLNCLPLYTQLGLDTEIFTSEQVLSMKQTAEENRKLAGLPAGDQGKRHRGVTSSPKPAAPVPAAPAPAAPVPAAPVPAPAPPPELPGSAEHSVLSASQGLGSAALKGAAVEQSKAEAHEGRRKERDRVKGKSVETGRSAGGGGGRFTDADLDTLLENDDVGHQPHGQGDVPRSAGIQDKSRSWKGQGSSELESAARQEAMEQDLDDLLAMETGRPSQSATVTDTRTRTAESKMVAETADLEDWLDSVLDD